MIARSLQACLLALCSLAAQAGPLDIADAWTDDQDRAVKLSQWRGRPLVLAMEYADCRFMCSIQHRKLQEIQAEADRRKLDIDFVVLSLDPKRDTPAAWRKFREARDVKRPNWHFLTGTRAATDRAVLSLGVKWWYYDEHILHEINITRLAASGEVVKAMKTYDMSAAEFLN